MYGYQKGTWKHQMHKRTLWLHWLTKGRQDHKPHPPAATGTTCIWPPPPRTCLKASWNLGFFQFPFKLCGQKTVNRCPILDTMWFEIYDFQKPKKSKNKTKVWTKSSIKRSEQINWVIIAFICESNWQLSVFLGKIWRNIETVIQNSSVSN